MISRILFIRICVVDLPYRKLAQFASKWQITSTVNEEKLSIQAPSISRDVKGVKKAFAE